MMRSSHRLGADEVSPNFSWIILPIYNILSPSAMKTVRSHVTEPLTNERTRRQQALMNSLLQQNVLFVGSFQHPRWEVIHFIYFYCFIFLASLMYYYVFTLASLCYLMNFLYIYFFVHFLVFNSSCVVSRALNWDETCVMNKVGSTGLADEWNFSFSFTHKCL